MELCSNNHDEVCYEVRFCPMCEKINEIDDLKEEIEELETEIAELEEKLHGE